ncbi:MAG: hypothetical protein H7A36_02930 [Chlamydiales bacterium]|nr:hypothetical protein [Chlamydiales bacterium]
MRKFYYLQGVLLTLLLTGCFHAKQKEQMRYLYILHASSARFVSDPSNPQIEGALTLYDTDDTVIYFTQSDEHESGTIPLPRFINHMVQQSIANQDLTNAGFLFFEAENKVFQELTLGLSDPSIDPVNETLNFKVHALDAEFAFEEKKMQEVTLFFESASVHP